MSRIKVNILGLYETRYPNCGDIASDKHRFIYAGGERKFKKRFGMVLEIIIIMGALNAKLGKEKDREITSNFRLGTRNAHRENWSNVSRRMTR